MSQSSRNAEAFEIRRAGEAATVLDGLVAKPDVASSSPDNDNDRDPPPTPAAPAAALAIPSKAADDWVAAHVEPLSHFNSRHLSDWNERVQSDPSALGPFEAAVFGATDWAHLFGKVAETDVDQSTARSIIKQVCFPAASLNRHYLVAAAQAGDLAAGKSRLEEAFRAATGTSIGSMLAVLSAQGAHPAYHSYHGYWLSNPERIGFTRDPGEAYFHAVVNATNLRFAQASELLKPLQMGDVLLDRVGAAGAISAAHAAIADLHDAYNFLARDPATGERRMTPKFFMYTMRSYIAPASLLGQEVEGPNATYTPGWPRLDFALDNRDPSYVETVRGRYRWMVHEHRALLEQAVELPSVNDQILSQLGLAHSDRGEGFGDLLANRIGGASRPMRASIKAYAGLAETFAKISGTHFSMIMKYLVKPAEKLSQGEIARIVPNPNAGVGGNHIRRTEEIFHMRREQPLNNALIGLARQLD